MIGIEPERGSGPRGRAIGVDRAHGGTTEPLVREPGPTRTDHDSLGFSTGLAVVLAVGPGVRLWSVCRRIPVPGTADAPLSERVPQWRWFSMLRAPLPSSTRLAPRTPRRPVRADRPPRQATRRPGTRTPPPRPRVVRRAAAVVLAVVLAVCSAAGCAALRTITGPTPSPTVDLEERMATANARRLATASASAAQAATAAASAIAALSPQERALRDTALATPAPQRPAEADQHDMAGAVAAAEYFITLYPYVYATGDLTDFRAMSAATCKFCNTVITKVTDMHTAGGWIDPWGQQTTFTSISDDPSTPDRYVVELNLVSDEHVSHRMGEPPKTYEASQGPILIQLLWKDGTGWTIEEVAPK